MKGTPFDFREPKPVGQDIDADDEQIKHGAGYDHCYVLNKAEEGELSFAARLVEPKSGRTMEVYTTEPGVQLYTDNWADGYAGQHGATFPAAQASASSASTSPILLTAPTSPALCCVRARSIARRPSTSLASTNKLPTFLISQIYNLKT